MCILIVRRGSNSSIAVMHEQGYARRQPGRIDRPRVILDLVGLLPVAKHQTSGAQGPHQHYRFTGSDVQQSELETFDDMNCAAALFLGPR